MYWRTHIIHLPSTGLHTQLEGVGPGVDCGDEGTGDDVQEVHELRKASGCRETSLDGHGAGMKLGDFGDGCEHH